MVFFVPGEVFFACVCRFTLSRVFEVPWGRFSGPREWEGGLGFMGEPVEDSAGDGAGGFSFLVQGRWLLPLEAGGSCSLRCDPQAQSFAHNAVYVEGPLHRVE